MNHCLRLDFHSAYKTTELHLSNPPTLLNHENIDPEQKLMSCKATLIKK